MTNITNLRTAMTPIVMPPKPEAAAPFASYPEAYLARMLEQEAADVRKRLSKEGGRYNAVLAPRRDRRGASSRGVPALAAAEAARAKVFAALTRPMPISAICMVVGMSVHQIGGHLATMRADGLVNKIPGVGNRGAIWSKVAK